MSGAPGRGRATLGALSPEQRQAGLAACGLVVSLFLPWYEKTAFVRTRSGLVQGKDNLSAFQVISFVEAAVLLVAGGVLYLLWARAQRKPFHLPGGDGTVIAAAGAWAALLLIWRLFDKPDVEGIGVTVGVAWGWFVALLMSGLVAAAGMRLRAAHRPEPPNPVADDIGWDHPPRRERDPSEARTRTMSDVTEVTQALADRPSWEGEPPPEPGRARPAAPPEPARPAAPPEPRAPDDRPPDDRLF